MTFLAYGSTTSYVTSRHTLAVQNYHRTTRTLHVHLDSSSQPCAARRFQDDIKQVAPKTRTASERASELRNNRRTVLEPSFSRQSLRLTLDKALECIEFEVRSAVGFLLLCASLVVVLCSLSARGRFYDEPWDRTLRSAASWNVAHFEFFASRYELRGEEGPAACLPGCLPGWLLKIALKAIEKSVETVSSIAFMKS